MNIKTKGFTLIELLVVIAIIGILSSVVLASLNTARSKGQDAAVKSNMNGIRAQAELYYDDNGNKYATADGIVACTTSGSLFVQTNIAAAIKGIDSNNGSNSPVCYASTTGWAISSGLNSGGSWCVDSNGKATTTIATGAGC